MIETVVFDIGKVLMGWDPDMTQFFPAKDAKIVDEAIFGTGYWDELDLGILSEKEIFDKMYDYAPGYEKQIRFVLNNMDRLCTRKDYAISMIASLKCAGYKTYYLSNYSAFVRNAAPHVLNFLPYMDGGMFSYEEHLSKPDPAFYQRLFDKYQLDPKTCLFVDDRPENLEAAEALGMQTLLFTDYQRTYPYLLAKLN